MISLHALCRPSAHLSVAAAETKALGNHSVDLPLPVLLANALVGRQPRQRPIQVVVVRLADDEQPSSQLDYTHITKCCYVENLSSSTGCISNMCNYHFSSRLTSRT